MSFPTVETLFFRLLVLFTAIPLHEWAHAYTAHKLGDQTIRYSGRLSLNPFNHFDPIGTISLMIFGIGWAKPVPVNSRYFKNIKRDMAITAAAGPICNLIIAFICMILYKIVFYSFVVFNLVSMSAISFASELFVTVISINLMLAVFNLLPIPPLDGSRILNAFLPSKWSYYLFQYEDMIRIALIALLFFGFLGDFIWTISSYLYAFINWATGFIDIIFQVIA